ncbi:SAV_2336 N-terminal domain-related protein, partial [Streptomyces sp. NPDC046197]|uniref:SAV_2336 N-terminal domain-related protein n=1 Tax=Streptomyces sp. NPDC046197 TaxID=3154337 RepID=UPI0033D0BF01
MLGRLRDVLTASGVALCEEELLDVLWLAGKLPRADGPLARAVTPPAPSGRAVPDPEHPCPDSPALDPPAKDTHPGTSEGRQPDLPLHAAPQTTPRQAADATPHGALPVRAPDRRLLDARELRLGKSLRPLRQRFPDRRHHEIDIAGTVAAMAETGLPETVTRPARNRWLSLALLVDDGVSMVLWQRLATEVRTLMERAGAFRDIRVYGLDTRSPRAPRLSSRPYQGRKAGLAPAGISDPTGDTLVLVISDGVGDAWWDGRMRKALDFWARRGPSAIVHALPPRLWASSGITAQEWQITTCRRGGPTTAWHVTDPVLPADLVSVPTIPVPVLQPSPAAIAEWCRLIASPSATALLPLWPGGQDLPARPYADTRHTTGAQALLRFRSAASPEAYRLAAHLAAVAPVTPPVMRLVQSALGPPTDIGHLVEVFLGGLMHRSDADAPARLPHQQHFDFSEDVRGVLLSTVPPRELLRTTRAIGDHLEAGVGRSPSFTAWLAHPTGSFEVGKPDRSFAQLNQRLLRRLGVPPVAERSADSNRQRPQQHAHLKPVPAAQTGESAAEPRRFLIATAVSRHPMCPQGDRPGLVEARQRVIDVFTHELGYQHHSQLGPDPTRMQLLDQLRAFCTSADRREDDLVAVYFAGHGEVLDSGDHVLFTADTDPAAVAHTALSTQELAGVMLRNTQVRRLLLILDTCYSGGSGNGPAATELNRVVSEQWGQAVGSGLVVLSSAQPHQQAEADLFPRQLAEAVGHRDTAGSGHEALSVSAVVQQINHHPDRPAFQRISLFQGLTGEPPAFLASPRHGLVPSGADLAARPGAEPDEYARRRETELTARLLTHAMGHDGDAAKKWWFYGRRRALADLTAWLREPATDGRSACRVVTAGPGSGKTSVLGVIAALGDPEHRRTVPVDALGLDPQEIPDAGAVDVAVDAQNLTDTDVLRALAAAAQVDARTVGELLEALPTPDHRRAPFTVIIDALDEAATPDSLCSEIVRPLIDHSDGRIRLLLGTRRFLLDRLAITAGQVIDLDDARYADPQALQAYTARTLLEAHPSSPYRRSPEAVRPVAQAVATAAGTSFLVARITASVLASADHVVPDPSDQAWRAGLPRHAEQAMREDLARRFGVGALRAIDLLRPLAFAQGGGLPWENIWAPLATAISGRGYTDEDLLWLRHTAGSYVVETTESGLESTESGHSVYRLYHLALAEILRDGVDLRAVHAAFVDVLLERVPHRVDGTLDWSRAHPYALAHLAFHAAEAERLDDLLGDAEYLVHVPAVSLAPHLSRARSEPARLAAAAYRTSMAFHGAATPAARREVLARDAARTGATALQHQLDRSVRQAVRSRRAATGRSFFSARPEALAGHVGPVHAVACTVLDGGPTAITASHDQTVRAWDLHTGTQLFQMTGHTGPVHSVACTVLDGRPTAITGSRDQTVRAWDLHTGTQLFQMTGHTGPV